MDVNNKNILFIGPRFHGYEEMISRKLEANGAKVFFVPERSYGWDFRLVNNFSNARLKALQVRHYRRMEKAYLQTGIRFDYLFVIRGFMLPEETIQAFRQKFPEALTIMYQWDSNNTNPFVHLVRHFDKVLSFDFEDCRNFPVVKYLPLFYTDDVKAIRDADTPKEFDFFFMGWCFPERYNAVIAFRDFAEANGYTLKAFLYQPFSSKLKSTLKGEKLDPSIVSTKHMPRHEYIATLAKSRVMVDVSNPRQTGLAMRVIEALASKTKVLTNNRRIMEDGLVYDPEFVQFFNPDKPEVMPAFVWQNNNGHTVKTFSIEEWLHSIFQ